MHNGYAREKELYEYVSTTHLLCIIISICAFIVSENVPFKTGFYPLMNLRVILFLCLLGFAAVLFYNSRYLLYQENSLSFLVNPLYMLFSLTVVVITLFTVKDALPQIQTLLLLPVIITASSMGKNAGLIMAGICTVFLLSFNLLIKNQDLTIDLLQHNLVLLSVMYVLSWFIGGLRDVEAKSRKHLHKALSALKEDNLRRRSIEEKLCKLSRAIEQVPSMLMVASIDGVIEYINNKYTAVTGYLPEEVIGKNIFDFNQQYSAGEFTGVLEMVRSGAEWQGEMQKKKKNGELYWEWVSVSPFLNPKGVITDLIMVAEDITKNKAIDKEMARLERLNLVGEMAAAIGHEVRNPMTTVRGFLQMLGKKEDCRQFKEYFDLMIAELDRANSIITEFLNMAKNKPVDKKFQNLNDVLKTISPLILAHVLESNNKIIIELEKIPDLYLDDKEIKQLVLNLVRNGLEAMSASGNLTIKTFSDGKEVVLSVRDEGEGIAPEILEKLGTPFVTTKEYGTGLGLAVSYSIAARHDAKIDFATGSRGTDFKVIFKVPEKPEGAE